VADASIRVIFLPHSGAQASVFRPWLGALPPWLVGVPTEYPGRGTRFAEPPHTQLTHLLDELVEAVLSLADRPYALFGHSLGAIVGYELAQRLRDNGGGPVHLFVSGHRAPQLDDAVADMRDLSDGELVARLTTLGGTPTELLAEPEMRTLVLKVLRADLALSASRLPQELPPLKCPITALGGDDDPMVPPETLPLWRRHSGSAFKMQILPGNHFFVFRRQAEVLATIEAALSPWRGT
jgi:surfactin synthase thioesterase subunit